MSTGAMGGGGDAVGQGLAGGESGGTDIFGNPLGPQDDGGYEQYDESPGDDAYGEYDDGSEIDEAEVTAFVEEFPELNLEDPQSAHAFVELSHSAADYLGVPQLGSNVGFMRLLAFATQGVGEPGDAGDEILLGDHLGKNPSQIPANVPRGDAGDAIVQAGKGRVLPF